MYNGTTVSVMADTAGSDTGEFSGAEEAINNLPTATENSPGSDIYVILFVL